MKRALRFFLLGLMHGVRALSWLAEMLLGPPDRALQRGVNAVVWGLEERGVERARIYYTHDACIVLSLLVLTAIDGSWVGIVLALVVMLAMHARGASHDYPPVDAIAQVVKASIIELGSVSVYGHLANHRAKLAGPSALYFSLLLLGHYVHRVPRTRPPRRRKAPALQPAME